MRSRAQEAIGACDSSEVSQAWGRREAWWPRTWSPWGVVVDGEDAGSLETVRYAHDSRDGCALHGGAHLAGTRWSERERRTTTTQTRLASFTGTRGPPSWLRLALIHVLHVAPIRRYRRH